MLIEMDEKEKKFLALSEALHELGEKENLKIQALHEDIFNSMHRI
jgi:predicted amino acid-binding ACT domain protein